MKDVVACPLRNSGCRSTFSRNRMFVYAACPLSVAGE